MKNEIEQIRRALSLLSTREFSDVYVTEPYTRRDIVISHISETMRDFLDKVLGSQNRSINRRRPLPNGSLIHYGNLLCLRESIAVLQYRYRGREDFYENQDLCEGELIPFLIGPDGWLYCVKSTYLEDEKPEVLVISDSARSYYGGAQNARVEAAGVIPLSIGGLMEVFASHSELEDGEVLAALDRREQLPPDSLVKWRWQNE